MIRVMIVANHADVREGLRTVLRLVSGLAVTGADGLESAARLAGLECPQVALVDLEMPEGEGLEVIRRLRGLCPCTQSIALTAHDIPSARESALQAGASLVMLKGLDVLEMVAGIQALSSAAEDA
jgi:DNA-binding NarL/FixJ family response regulator